MPKTQTPEEVRVWFIRALQELWPVALGSLSLHKSPCIREHCSACASGVGHESYALSGARGAQRFSIYVPAELVPDLQRAVANGRRVQELIKEAGLRYVQARKRERRLRARLRKSR